MPDIQSRKRIATPCVAGNGLLVSYFAYTSVSTRADTLAGCRAILDGEADDWAESSLYMIGSLDEARQKEAAAAKTERPS